MTTLNTGSQGIPNPFLPSEIQPPEEDDRLRVFLIDTLQKMIDVINDKTIGIYLPTEVYNGEVWNYINPQNIEKYGYRTIIYIPAPLPNVGSQIYPHNIQGINSAFAITNIYAAASDRVNFKYRLITGDDCTMDDTNVTLTTTFDGTTYQAYVVIEYLRNA